MTDTLSWKTFLLVRSEILGLFGNTLTADHMYSRHYLGEVSGTCSNAIITKTKNIFDSFYCIFAVYTLFCAFPKKGQLLSLNITEAIDSEKCCYLNARKPLF